MLWAEVDNVCWQDAVAVIVRSHDTKVGARVTEDEAGEGGRATNTCRLKEINFNF